MASAVTIRGFDYMTKRLMPTRENLRRVHRGAAMSEEDIAGVELMLYLIRAADVVRESVYSGLRERELSEGKFALLMTLFDADGPVPVVELAKRIGVSAPTTSVMVTRMLQAENPLIAKVQSKADAVAGSSNSPTRAGRSSRPSFPRIPPEWPTSRNACRAMSASR